MIAIIDYGVGNSASIKNMLNRIGYESIITNKASDLESADKLIYQALALLMLYE